MANKVSTKKKLLTSLEFAALYAIAGILWITVINIVLMKVFMPNELFSWSSTFHAGYFLISAFIVYALVRRILSAKDAIQSSEERYRSLFENNHAVMLLIDPETAEIVDANPAALKYYGYSKEDISSMKISDINILTKEQVFREMEKAKLEERSHFHFRHRLTSGEIRDVEVFSGPIAIHGRKLLYSIVHDITERKRVQLALRESEIKFRSLTEESLVGVYLIQDGVFKYVNPRLSEIFGYSVEEVIDKLGPENLVWPEDWPIVEENLRKRITGEIEAIEYGFRGRTKKGEPIYVEVYGSRTVYMGKPAVIGTLLDITERKRAEEQLSRLASIPLQNPYPLIETDLEGNVTFINPAAERQFPHLQKMGLKHALLKDFQQIVSEVVDREKKSLIREISLNGKYFEQALYYVPKSKLLRIFTFEITERRRFEQQLRDSRERYRRLVDLSPDGIVVHSEGRIVFANLSAAKIIGSKSTGPLIGRPIFDLVHPDFKEIARERIDLMIKQKKKLPFVEEKFVKLNGETIDVEVTAMPFTYKMKPALQVVFRDITGRKRSEAELKKKDLDIRRAYVDVINAVTGGRLIIMSDDEVKTSLGEPISGSMFIETYRDLSDIRTKLMDSIQRVFPEFDVDSLIIAANEAVTNAVKHGGGGKLQVFRADNTTQILVTDSGPGIDFKMLPKATLLSGFSTKQTLGVGFDLILELCDRVLLSTQPGNTSVVLEKSE